MSESQFQTIIRLTEQLKVARDNYEHAAKERDDLRRRIDHAPFKIGNATPNQIAALKSLTPRALTISFSEWTTEPPTEPGWYWVRSGETSHAVEVRSYNNILEVYSTGHEVESALDAFDLWAGPIEAPEVPK